MLEYSLLLRELGIKVPVQTEDLVIHKTNEEREYDWYCEQEYACRVDSNGRAIEYKDEQEMDWVKKHRYSRPDRFRFILYRLLNVHGHIPVWLHRKVRGELRKVPVKPSPAKIWNQIRAILKRTGNQKYYNDIPSFIKFSCGLKPKFEGAVIPKILRDFDKMHANWDNLAFELGRKYFPNLRYVALKLIKKHGINHPYKVVMVRTLRKQNYLDEIFDRL